MKKLKKIPFFLIIFSFVVVAASPFGIGNNADGEIKIEVNTAIAQSVGQCQSAYGAFRTGSTGTCTYNGKVYQFKSFDQSRLEVNLMNVDGNPADGLRINSNNTIAVVNPETGRIVTPATTGQSGTQAKTEAAKPADQESACGFWNFIGAPITCTTYAFMSFFAWLLGVAGLLLDAVVTTTVIQLPAFLTSSGLIRFVEQAWTFMRDIANIVLIFSLLLIGISTILRIEEYGAKKLLAMIIFAAILINFSLAFTRIIIDASNYVSYQLYYQTFPFTANQASGVGTRGTISQTFMESLKLTTLYSNAGDVNQAKVKDIIGGTKSFIVFLMGSILFAIVAYSFLIAAFHFIGRMVVFLIVMVLSPLAILAYFLPFYKSFWKQWWDALWSNAIMAPAYFALLYFVIQAIQAIGRANPSVPFSASILEPSSQNIGTFLSFAIVIALALIMLSAARKIGTEGVHVINLSTKAIGKYGGGFVARNTAGRIFYKAAQSETTKSFVANRPVIGGLYKRTLDVVSKGKFGTSKGYEQAVAAKKKSAESLNKFAKSANAPTPPIRKEGETDDDWKERVEDYEKKKKISEDAGKKRSETFIRNLPSTFRGDRDAQTALQVKFLEEEKKKKDQEERDKKVSDELVSANERLLQIHEDLRKQIEDRQMAEAGGIDPSIKTTFDNLLNVNNAILKDAREKDPKLKLSKEDRETLLEGRKILELKAEKHLDEELSHIRASIDTLKKDPSNKPQLAKLYVQQTILNKLVPQKQTRANVERRQVEIAERRANAPKPPEEKEDKKDDAGKKDASGH